MARRGDGRTLAARLAVALSVTLCGCSVAVDAEKSTNIENRRIGRIESIERIRSAIVRVVHLGSRPALTLLGTGFFVNTDGHVVTANHVMEKGREIIRARGGSLGIGIARDLSASSGRGNFIYLEATTIDAALEHDLALLRVNEHLSEARKRFGEDLGPTGYVRLKPTRPSDGMEIATSGFPFDFTTLITTQGWVASAWQFSLKNVPLEGSSITIPRIANDVYVAQVPTNHGNSGGPVYAVEDSAVIGVVLSFVAAPVEQRKSGGFQPLKEFAYNAGLTFVIPATQVIELLKRNAVTWYPA
jgi:S1-C subfamily serine protease